MSKRLFPYLIFSILILFTSCGKEDKIDVPDGFFYPIAAFSFTGNEGPAPVDVQFTNHSVTIIEGRASYRWSFGNTGAQSTDKDPLHTFYNSTSDPISVLITLTVLDLESDSSQTRSIPIMIQPSSK